jgi:hypothetical protein
LAHQGLLGKPLPADREHVCKRFCACARIVTYAYTFETHRSENVRLICPS